MLSNKWIPAGSLILVITAIVMVIYESHQEQVAGISSTSSPVPVASPKENQHLEKISTSTEAPLRLVSLRQKVTIDSESGERDAKIEELQRLSYTYEAKSLPLIEPSLYSDDPKIRSAAVDAVVVLGAHEGGAVLRKASLSCRDPREASAMQDKADYVELPSIDPSQLKTIMSSKRAVSN